MVVPVPCRFWLLLKLLTRIFPLVSDPLVVGTRATPYGLRSPLLGIVEATSVMVPACAVASANATNGMTQKPRLLIRRFARNIRLSAFILFSPRLARHSWPQILILGTIREHRSHGRAMLCSSGTATVINLSKLCHFARAIGRTLGWVQASAYFADRQQQGGKDCRE